MIHDRSTVEKVEELTQQLRLTVCGFAENRLKRHGRAGLPWPESRNGFNDRRRTERL
jgi:hypothetical protein